MYENFENLPEEKKKRIIGACMEEFARNGYDKASTNNMVKKAGISKGAIFHYFGNKKNLYLYILDYIISYMTKRLYNIIGTPSTDVFERIMNTGLAKIRLAYEEPLMYEVLYMAFISTPEELKEEIQRRYNKIYAENVPAFIENIDMSRFRKDINPAKALETIILLIDALTNKYINIYRNKSANEVLMEIDKMVEEYREYFEILKKGLYSY
ncbi:MAG TPA: TetR/AcrR family transcriptional regulator [Clostridiaceae bacterium]|nr:TetR/AcrR family transcriptional regulator [Clostridiaceae bacterium]